MGLKELFSTLPLSVYFPMMKKLMYGRLELCFIILQLGLTPFILNRISSLQRS